MVTNKFLSFVLDYYKQLPVNFLASLVCTYSILVYNSHLSKRTVQQHEIDTNFFTAHASLALVAYYK